MKRISQEDRLLRLLREPPNPSYQFGKSDEWVSLPLIMNLGIASHTARISALRRKGHKIEIRDEYLAGQRRTAYRLVK